MEFIIAIAVFVGGVLAAASLIVAKKPDAKELIDKLTPYQGWIGIVLFFWSIYALIFSLQWMVILKIYPIFWIALLVSSLVGLLLGFLLGFGLITKYVLSKNEAAMKKGQELRQKLSTFQGPLGLVAIAASVLLLAARLVGF